METSNTQPGANDNSTAAPKPVAETKPLDPTLTNEKGEETKASINGAEETKVIEIGEKEMSMGAEVYNSTGASLGSSIINISGDSSIHLARRTFC